MMSMIYLDQMTAMQNKHNTHVFIEEKSIRWNDKAQCTFHGE